MAERRQLVDTSVLLRSHQPEVFERLQALDAENKLWTCRMVDLEYVYTRRARDVTATIRERLALPTATITSETMDRAIEIMELLATEGRHRHAPGTDCIIAASAEMHGLSVLHYDRDFDYIAEVTNLGAEWVAPPGSLDEPTHPKEAGKR